MTYTPPKLLGRKARRIATLYCTSKERIPVNGNLMTAINTVDVLTPIYWSSSHPAIARVSAAYTKSNEPFSITGEHAGKAFITAWWSNGTKPDAKYRVVVTE